MRRLDLPRPATQPPAVPRRRSTRLVRRARALLWLIALPFAALLAACGPGVGGTGTGADAAPLAPFGAAPAALCNSSLAAWLLCPPAGASTPVGTAASGTAPVQVADAYPAAQVQAWIDDNQITLTLHCPAWLFEGRWGSSAALGQRWFGRLQRQNLSETATLTLRLQADGTAEYTLFDAQGQVLAGPGRLQHVPGPTSPAACP